jgi:hypothetical protein
MSIKTIEELWEVYKLARVAEEIAHACLEHDYSDSLRSKMVNEIANIKAAGVQGSGNQVHFINALAMYLAQFNPVGFPEVIIIKSVEAILNFYKIEKPQNWESLTTKEKIEQVLKDVKVDLEEIQ